MYCNDDIRREVAVAVPIEVRRAHATSHRYPATSRNDWSPTSRVSWWRLRSPVAAILTGSDDIQFNRSSRRLLAAMFPTRPLARPPAGLASRRGVERARRGRAIFPGDLTASEMILRILMSDDVIPAERRPPLNAREMSCPSGSPGAEYKTHWAWTRPIDRCSAVGDPGDSHR